MKESTRALVVKPLLIQEAIVIVLLTPFIALFCPLLSKAVSEHFTLLAFTASLAAAFGLFLGILTKCLLVRPALLVLEGEARSLHGTRQAVRSLSRLPSLEAIVVFIRFGVTGNLIGNLPLYLMGITVPAESLWAGTGVFLLGVMAAPIVYLCSENGLTYFFERCSLKGILDGETKPYHMRLSGKALMTVSLVAVPPFLFVLALINFSQDMNISMDMLEQAYWVLLIDCVASAVMCGVMLMKNLSLSVEKMSAMIRDMAEGKGDLTKRISVTGLNEVGDLAFWFSRLMENLDEIIGHVRQTSLEMHRTVEGVSSGSQVLSQATQEQAAKVEEITSSIGLVSASLKGNAELIFQGRETSNTITMLIEENKRVFSELTGAIAGISQDSMKIGNIVSTVNEVAFHTNLLALNASVEAARAGEHGKGFAVVAGEVRSLAQRSAQASREIKSLIDGTVARIHNGDEMMKKTSASLEELMSRMESFFRMMELIDSSSSDQARSIGDVSNAVLQISSSTQKNASTAGELEGSMKNLRTMANILTKDVKKFRISGPSRDRNEPPRE